MGGAIHMNGNVSPAAEANIMNDPEAADYVFAHGTNVSLVGLDVTSKCELRREDIDLLLGSGKHGNFLHSILQSYHSYYNKVYNVDGVIPHDAVALISMIHDSLFDFRPGSVMVVTEGFSRGQTIWDSKSLKQLIANALFCSTGLLMLDHSFLSRWMEKMDAAQCVDG